MAFNHKHRYMHFSSSGLDVKRRRKQLFPDLTLKEFIEHTGLYLKFFDGNKAVALLFIIKRPLKTYGTLHRDQNTSQKLTSFLNLKN